MSPASIAERAKLSWFVAQRGLLRVAGSLYAHPLTRWQVRPIAADRLVIAPQDLRTADPTRASEIYSGRFALAGKVLNTEGKSPFELQPPSDEWAQMLYGFGWLRHLRAAESSITRANARVLVDEWISLHGAWNAESWRPDITARRVISWLTQAPLVLSDADARFYRRFLRSLTRQVRFLRYSIAEARDGLPRLQILMALTYAALCMAGQVKHLNPTVRRLGAELERQVLPDGGHISRNPGALIELLLDLLPLRQVFSARNLPPPGPLLNAVDRMMPMLRFFRHSDGSFALFNGMGPTPPDLLATVLAYDDARGAPLASAPHSGYQRLQTREAVLLMDTGRPPPMSVSQEAHAGCLAFEFSWRQHRIVVNCGVPGTSRDNWRQAARATAAHSTVTFNDASSCRFLGTGPLQGVLGTPITSGPKTVPVTREDRDAGIEVTASHDGYAERFGLLHERSVTLAHDASRLDGEDVFRPVQGGRVAVGKKDAFAIRFHLHPSVRASRLTDGKSVMLMLSDREVWTFTAFDARVELEESVYLASREGPRRTLQIVINGTAARTPSVRWAFIHVQPPETTRRRRSEEPELPL